MLTKLLTMLRQWNMLAPGDRLYCAVSGGADSMALLWAMYLLRDKLQLQLSAVHFNHHLRGAESDAEEAFVRQFCTDYGIDLVVGGQTVVPGIKGLEAAAREARYAFFATLPGKVATAHTADDNAETVLMRLVRGTGLKGLGGITPVRGSIIRPMLMVKREEVLAFLQEYSISYCEDSSNASDVFLRNRLRHHVMPLLRQENPRIAENLSSMAMHLREDEQALRGNEESVEALSVSALLLQPRAKRLRQLSAFLEHSGVKEPEESHLVLLESLVLSQNPSAKASFPGGIVITRCYDRLEVLQSKGELQERMLSCPGVTELPEVGLRVICSCNTMDDGFWVKPQGQLYARSRQPGDRIRLQGGSKTLKKLFIDRKIPAASRERYPVICDDLGILVVHELGANLDRVSHEKNAVCIKIEPMQ